MINMNWQRSALASLSVEAKSYFLIESNLQKLFPKYIQVLTFFLSNNPYALIKRNPEIMQARPSRDWFETVWNGFGLLPSK